MRVARGGAVGDHRNGFGGGVRRPAFDLDVENGGEAAKALCADAERIDLVEDLDAQAFGVVGGAACFQRGHIDVAHQRFFGKRHRLFRRPADADAEHSRWAPAGTHFGDLFEHPVDDRVRRVEHRKFRLVLAAAAFGGDGDLDRVAEDHLDIYHRGGVVAGVDAAEGGVGDDRGAQLVFGEQIGAAHAFIDDLLKRARGVEAAVLPPFDEDGDDAGILADRTVPLCTHAAVGQDLCDRVLGGGALLGFVGDTERADIVHRVEVRDVLQRVGNAFDEVGFGDRDHGGGDNRGAGDWEGWGCNAVTSHNARHAT